MLKEDIGLGRTVEAAIADGAAKLGVDASRIEYEIIEAPKKGFLGFGEAPAKVRVFMVVELPKRKLLSIPTISSGNITSVTPFLS